MNMFDLFKFQQIWRAGIFNSINAKTVLRDTKTNNWEIPKMFSGTAIHVSPLSFVSSQVMDNSPVYSY